MAIIFEFNVIVARKAEIDAKYPGGLAHFRVKWLARPPDRWCEDEHLLPSARWEGTTAKFATTCELRVSMSSRPMSWYVPNKSLAAVNGLIGAFIVEKSGLLRQGSRY